jgi:hypothetical protein
MMPQFLPLPDLRLALRWIAEAATPGKIAVAVSEIAVARRKHGRIILLDPSDATRNILMEIAP